MKRSGIAFVLLLVLCVAIMAAYVIQLQQGEDDELVTDEQAAESVEGSTTEQQAADSTKASSTDERLSQMDSQTLEKTIQETKHLQDKRKDLMDSMVEGGIAERIENPAGEPFVYVMKPFYGLSLEEQASLMNVIWSYYITEDRNSNVVTIYDNDTGQEIGTYSQAGLKMKE